MVKFIDSNVCSEKEENVNMSIRGKRKRRHVPHSERPKELVMIRNSRERQRARAVNDAFEILRDRIPFLDCENYKLTRVEILKFASKYIKKLFQMIVDSELRQLSKYNDMDNMEPRGKHDNSLSTLKETLNEENINLNTGISTTNTNYRMPFRNLKSMLNEDSSHILTSPEQVLWNGNIQQSWQSYSTSLSSNENDIHYSIIPDYGSHCIQNRTSCMHDDKNRMLNLQFDQHHDILEYSFEIQYSNNKFNRRLKYL